MLWWRKPDGASFAPPKQTSNSAATPSDTPLDVELLTLGKRMGLSFIELNELRVCDLLDMAYCFIGTNEDKPETTQATQADIVSFFG